MAINIIFAGDVVPIYRTKQLFLNKQTEYIFKDVIPILGQVDYSVVNYEAPVIIGKGNTINKSGPHLSSSPQTMEVIKEAGFKMITLANNHFRDQGDVGVKYTLDCAKRLGLEYVGGGENLMEAQKIKYVLIKNKKFAFLNFCEQEYSIATDDYGGSNPYDIINITRAIHRAKAKSDYVILMIHGGIEHYPLPSPRMKKEYRFFVEEGADVVINNHQHCFSGYEIFKGKPICYGLGNFCFDTVTHRYNETWCQALMTRISFDENKISLINIPIVQCGESPNVRTLNEGAYDERISELNDVILDDVKMELSYRKLVAIKQRKRLSQLNIFGNKIFDSLYGKGYLGNLHKMRRVYVAKDLLYCESHFEMLKEAIGSLIK